MTKLLILGSKRKPLPHADFSSLKADKSEVRKARKMQSQFWSAQQIFTGHLPCIRHYAGRSLSLNGVLPGKPGRREVRYY